jgi:hypothetical protein
MWQRAKYNEQALKFTFKKSMIQVGHLILPGKSQNLHFEK